MSTTRKRTFARTAKRGIDVLGAAALLTVSAPLLAAFAVLVRIRLGKPVLFRQERPGKDARPFTVYKFRTMRDAPGTDEERLTSFGRRLRATSLDEVPELWNVLRGDMSLVGPRPLLTAYLDRYSSEQARRHEMRPGITGWAQVNGRNALGWHDRFALDVWYVDHWTIGLDIRILLRTVWGVITRHGINSAGHATMPEFEGTDECTDECTDEGTESRTEDATE